MLATVQMKKITSYPVLLGIVIAFVLSGGIIAMASWFPSVGVAWDSHKRLVQAVWFTTAFFAVLVSYVWRWRLRGPFIFWASIGTLCLLHVIGILIYTVYIDPLLVWQWGPLFAFESLVAVFGVDWATWRFGRHSRRKAERIS
jgi:hypothetical protein